MGNKRFSFENIGRVLDKTAEEISTSLKDAAEILSESSEPEDDEISVSYENEDDTSEQISFDVQNGSAGRDASFQHMAKAANTKSKILTVIVIALIVIILIMMLKNNALKDEPAAENLNLVHPPRAAVLLIDENYEDVIKQFENAGFTNIETRKISDVYLGVKTTVGDVESVSINGETDFDEDSEYESDAEVIVRYHTYYDDPETQKADNEDKKKEARSNELVEFTSDSERITMMIPEWWEPEEDILNSTTEIEAYTIGDYDDPDGYLYIRTAESDTKLAFSDETFLKMLDVGMTWSGDEDITETKSCTIDGCNGLMTYSVSQGEKYGYAKIYTAIFHPDKKSGIKELGDHYTTFQFMLRTKDNDFSAFDNAISTVHFEYRDEDLDIVE